jgi:hypothetical protein
MVAVVTVFIVKQGIYQRASTPRVPSRANQAPVGQPAEDRAAGGGPAAGQESVAQLKQKAASRAAKLDANAKDELTKREVLKSGQKAAKRSRSADEAVITENEALEERQEPPAAAAPRALEDKEKPQEARGSVGRVTITPVREYDELMSRFGLPPVWDSSVMPEALGRVEPALRNLYVTGRAGSDSARVRLYLAEAARLRYAPGDSTLYQEIQRHYQRAIELAGPDAETARVAEQRLRSLER